MKSSENHGDFTSEFPEQKMVIFHQEQWWWYNEDISRDPMGIIWVNFNNKTIGS